MNIEPGNVQSRLGVIEWEKMKKQSLKPELLDAILQETEELIKILVTSIKRLKRNHALAWLNVRYWMFVFPFDVGRSMFDVHLLKHPRIA